jgi:hypothetical protein
MAQKRMLDKKISISEQVSNLPLEAQIIFTWSIPHADDLGLLPISNKTLKAMIIPMMNISQETFDLQIGEILKQKLWIEYEKGDQKFYRLPRFINHQTLKMDRQPQTYLKGIILDGNYKRSWKNAEKLGFLSGVDDDENQMETNGNQMEMEVKRREEKGSKDKYSTQGADIIKAFESVDPKNKTYYGNKTQRSACDFLINEYGLERILKVIKILPKTNKLDYIPTIYTPYDLKEKWGKLEAQLQKYQNKQPLLI